MNDVQYMVIPVPDDDEETSLTDLLDNGAPIWYAEAGLWADADALREYYEKNLPAQLGKCPEDFVPWEEIDEAEMTELGRKLAPCICRLKDPTRETLTETIENFLVEN